MLICVLTNIVFDVSNVNFHLLNLVARGTVKLHVLKAIFQGNDKN